MYSTHVYGKRKTDIIRFLEHQLMVTSGNDAALPRISSIQRTCLVGEYLHPLLIDDVFCDLG